MAGIQQRTFKNLNESNTFINGLFEKHMPYHLSRHGDNIILSTVFSDKYNVVVFDKELQPVYALNAQNGLGSINAQYSIQFGHVLWTGLDNRIAKIEVGNAIHHFGPESGLDSPINNILELDGVMYVANNKGLFRYDFDEYGLPTFTQLESYPVQMLTEFKVPGSKKKLLIAGGSVDTKIYENGKRSDDKIAVDGSCLMQSKKHPELLYIGSKKKVSYAINIRNGKVANLIGKRYTMRLTIHPSLRLTKTKKEMFGAHQTAVSSNSAKTENLSSCMTKKTDCQPPRWPC